MESMDISYCDDKLGEISGMMCDEEQHECYEGQNIAALQVSHKVLVNELDSQNGSTIVTEQQSSSPEMNIPPVPSSNFPAETSESATEPNRFPLQDTKDCNQFNVIQRSISSIERLKGNLMNTTNLEFCGSDKENISTETCNTRLSEFPTETKSQGCSFPLDDMTKFVSARSSLEHSSLSEEHFTPAIEYHFSAADFDCLLSRGCSQSTSSSVQSTTGYASSPSIANLPRNSVLANFDPLLRRQTIVKAENKGTTENFGGDPSAACLALVSFSQEQAIIGSTLNTPVSSNISNDRSEQQLQDSTLLLLNTLDSSLTPQLQNSLSTSKDKQHQEETSCFILETTVVSNDYGSQDNIECSLDKTLTKEENETSNSSKSTEHLLFSTSSIVQEVLDCKKGEHIEPLVEILNSDVDVVQLAQANVDPEELSELNLDFGIPSLEDLTVEQLQEPVVKVSLPVKQAVLEVTTEPTVDLSSTVIFASASDTHHGITFHDGNMIAETHPEKQNISVLKMSEDRSIPNEEGYVEVGKKCKPEEVNIADIEKKMHDVELREEGMLKRITEKDKTISKMSNVVEAYERTIAELISEKEILIRNHEVECESLKQDNEINAQHLESLEKTFSNLYAKYERMKKNAIKYKENEDKLLEKVLKLEECLRAQEQRYEKMKSHAMSQLEIANTKIDEALRNHSQESAKLKAQIKKEELYRISINEQLIQKSKENEELVKICDELISETN
ncbi:uncharacterized protein LOC128714339 [Anopheles marshallii]|uniref:uncharacterized protein LOC128714339 n=1 Tax=Anopheles marshallii TaxID=1521116 RepID=UPI00237A9228|nr:uncharacterized protein LOC128714339 [Anopheles marshallii]